MLCQSQNPPPEQWWQLFGRHDPSAEYSAAVLYPASESARVPGGKDCPSSTVHVLLCGAQSQPQS